MKVLHISFNNKIKMPMVPKQPDGNDIEPTEEVNLEEEALFTENLPPRVCFSPTIEECFLAVWPNVHHYFEDPKYDYPYMDFYVYGTETGDLKRVSDEEMKKNVYDYHITREVAFLEPVKAKIVGKVRIFNPVKDRTIQIVHTRPYDDPKNEVIKIGPRVRYQVLRHYDLSYDLREGDSYKGK